MDIVSKKNILGIPHKGSGKGGNLSEIAQNPTPYVFLSSGEYPSRALVTGYQSVVPLTKLTVTKIQKIDIFK